MQKSTGGGVWLGSPDSPVCRCSLPLISAAQPPCLLQTWGHCCRLGLCPTTDAGCAGPPAWAPAVPSAWRALPLLLCSEPLPVLRQDRRIAHPFRYVSTP